MTWEVQQLGWRAAVAMQERFNISDVEPVFPAPAHPVGFEHANLAPESYGIGMHMQQMSDLGDSE